ncbi:ectoine/hydroxyectoine ABC transporter ATP-binding protein EhuA [Paracoccus sp. pheM1]|uniref:ectoine/hydroxyectoine ABC transporter ATP-binding protein EhuA n=1 Tax=Paracoccus sp. pheM1 TaxID=2831675 RepID=UPI001BDB746B|nr:ectoine/hydroxyectoine ABC transporter ATP-binding protein EhuA [Paracoccus sp. pheM1]MBT0781455.1 ectoine/hydroxyectoine ABC transporter ATP-binding protein EhuA [Paracoccus sp. pheM1]
MQQKDDDGNGFIRFEGVSKRFGHVTVLKDLNLAIRRGEKVSLIGPSGSGKTTILRILMTLERIEGGVVWIGDKPLWHRQTGKGLEPANESHLRVMRRSIGMVFQHFNLFPHMTAFENVARPPQLALGTRKDEAEETARTLLAKVGLSAKMDHYPSQLSGGQKQRVAIARALAMRPEIMLFDEVTSALDPELVEEVLNVLRDISRETKMTMLMVTHEMSFAHEFSDRILFLDGGSIVEQGHPDEIFGNPREERTRSFLKKVVAAGQRLD